VLLFPSAKEPYGAIAAEILPFGLPIIASDIIGAIGESILPDVNALLYAAGDVASMGKQLRRLVEDEHLRAEFSRQSLELADAHDKSVMSRDIMNICLQR
ncbi:MAG: glycosyltransferase, partial [Arenicella sp.]|nr:glycosyltransferase [Arenicella sp.]